MGADVAEAAGHTALRGIGSPGGLLLPFALEPRPQPALDVFGPDRLDVAELPGQDHLAGLPHERVAGVVVGDHEHRRRGGDKRRELLRLGERQRERLVTDDMKARRECGLGHGKVHVVRRGDGHKVDPLSLWQGSLGVEHLLVGAIAAVGSNVVVGGTRPGAGWVAREGAGHEDGPVVEHGGRHMHPTDERALAPPHDPHPQLPAQPAVGRHRLLPVIFPQRR